MGSQSKKCSSRGRRLLAFHSSIFALTFVLPTPVDLVVIPFFIGMKFYRMILVFLILKMIVAGPLLIGVVTSAVKIPADIAMGQGPVGEAVTQTVNSASSSELLWLLGVSLIGVSIDLAALFIFWIYPAWYVRKHIYSRISHMLH